jgi:hemoglobin/transferrin/lactoferrin receptor protein
MDRSNGLWEIWLTKVSSSSNLYDKIQATAAYQNFQESRSDDFS